MIIMYFPNCNPALRNLEAASEAMTDMPPRAEEELDPGPVLFAFNAIYIGYIKYRANSIWHRFPSAYTESFEVQTSSYVFVKIRKEFTCHKFNLLKWRCTILR